VCILILDIGSSSTRAVLFADDLSIVPDGIVNRVHQISVDGDGAAVMDAAAIRAEVESCLDEILQHPRAQDIRAVGMDTLVGNMLGVGADGHPLTPIFTYADSRSAEDVELLREKINEEDAHQRTGCLNHTAYHPGKLHWLRRHDPETFAQVRRWTDIATYLYEQWFGRVAACSYSVASWSGLLNRAALTWDKDWLSVLGMEPSQFPPLADFDEAMTGFTPVYARRWPQLDGCAFFLAIGDGAAANVGIGAIDALTMALTVGTTGAVRRIVTGAVPQIPGGLWGYRVDAAHHLIGGATSEGGNVYQWVADHIRLDEDVESVLLGRPADEHGLTFIPLLAGERAPGWATNASGAIIGLRMGTSGIDMLQAALEGVAIRLRIIAEQLTQQDAPTIIASGGALLASPAFTQIIANAFARELHLADIPESTARGTALLIQSRLNGQPPSAYPAPASTIIRPVADEAEKLSRARERQMAWYRQVVTNAP
jgi:gluconokinase